METTEEITEPVDDVIETVVEARDQMLYQQMVEINRNLREMIQLLKDVSAHTSRQISPS